MDTSTTPKWLRFALALVIAGTLCVGQETLLATTVAAQPVPPEIDPGPPDATTKLVFVHASIGEMWLAPFGELGNSEDGNGYSLTENNYFVSDYNTHNHLELPGHDYCAWKEVFGDPSWMTTLLNHSVKEGTYDRLADPGGQNDIVMIKPCVTQYPIYGNPDDPPGGTCPAEGVSWTVSEVKQTMLDTLESLRDYPDTFFVLVTAPPKCLPGVNGCSGDFDQVHDGANPRAVADWMVNDLLDGYDVGNVMVFDLYNALTSNHEGSGDTCPEDWTQSDVALETGNHHRLWNNQIQHQVQYNQNYSAYCKAHPRSGGLRKATQEFVPLLNAYYNAWVDGQNYYSPADINQNCEVDVADIQAVTGRWRCTTDDGCYDSQCDLDGDSAIDVLDIMTVANRWGCRCGDDCYTP